MIRYSSSSFISRPAHPLGVLWRNRRFESKRIQLFIGVLESCCAVGGVELRELLNRSAPFPVAVLGVGDSVVLERCVTTDFRY